MSTYQAPLWLEICLAVLCGSVALFVITMIIVLVADAVGRHRD